MKKKKTIDKALRNTGIFVLLLQIINLYYLFNSQSGLAGIGIFVYVLAASLIYTFILIAKRKQVTKKYLPIYLLPYVFFIILFIVIPIQTRYSNALQDRIEAHCRLGFDINNNLQPASPETQKYADAAKLVIGDCRYISDDSLRDRFK